MQKFCMTCAGGLSKIRPMGRPLKKLSVSPNQLRALRLDRGLTQAQMAKRLHMAQQTYHRYEIGQTELKVRQIEQFAEALGCDPAEILGQPMLGAIPAAIGHGDNLPYDDEVFTGTVALVRTILVDSGIAPEQEARIAAELYKLEMKARAKGKRLSEAEIEAAIAMGRSFILSAKSASDR